MGMNGPAGAIVAGCGVTASSGARRSGARSPRSPGAPPCTRSPTILGCACADRCSRGSWSRWRACRVVAARPHAPRRSLRSAVGRTVFYYRAVCCRAPVAGRVLLPLSARPDAGVKAAVAGPWQRCVSAARCCGVFLPPQKAQCNPGGATSRLGASALPIARNGSPLDMALSARIGDAREGGRKTQMPQQPAASRPGDAEHNV